ncbi:hypothetical protein AU194_04645 [Mycobacterium sp. GA-2829]|nr:STAS domain-containing protein [Mycobacterium sp. GA-2829]KUI26786.1 hypothetical protein AU194_04645 [Mycobacterium sp. GA-2829]
MADLTSHPTSETIECGSARLVRSQGPVEVLTVTGEIDSAEAEELAAHVQPAVARRGPGVLDLSGVAFLSVAGFRALRAWSYQARETGGNWVLIAGPAVAPYLRSVGRDELLPVAYSVAQAHHMVSTRPADRQPMPLVDADRTVC